MPPVPTPSASSTLGKKASTVISIILTLGLHRVLLGFAQNNETEIEIYLHTLLLLILPKLIGSFQHLMQYQRWLAYYAIWFQLMVDTCSENDIVFILFDLTIFMNMESIFQRHLKKITGGQPVPRTVYWSSWISNTRIESYIAAHRSVENIVNNNEKYNSNEQTVSPNSTTTATTNTTALKIKAKLSYLLASIVLLANVYREVKSNYIDYFCFHGPDASGFYLNPANNYISINPEYAAYCYPPDSTLEITLRHYLPFLNTSIPSLSLALAHLSGLLFAVAWSTIPTDVITTAWTQMWNSPSGRLRKIYYFIIMYPIKMTALGLIMLYTPDEREDVAPTNYSPSPLSAFRAKYLSLWFIFFRAATKLAFGLGFIWHIYAASSTAGVGCGYREKEEEYRVDEKEEKVKQ